MSKFTALAAVAAITLGSAVSATPVTIYASWTGSASGSATGTFTVDDSIFGAASGYMMYSAAAAGITNSNLSVTSSGNTTTYDNASMSDWSYYLVLDGAVDPTTELLAQSNFYDFNMFGNNGIGEPYGISVNTFYFGTTGETFTLTSLSPTALPAVPVPASLPLMAAGIGALAVLRRRKKAA